jgi:hypothetical protein
MTIGQHFSPRHIIFSRKGFDSANGRVASPIFPDGSWCSIPILLPRGRPLGDCYATAPRLADVVRDLTRGKTHENTLVHLSPDLRSEAAGRKPGWLPALGQEGAAQRVLANCGVGPGDIFLFFGWFRRVERNGGWHYVRGAPDLHCLFGWLQIGEVLSLAEDVTAEVEKRPWLAAHPHLDPEFARRSACLGNTVYVATPKLTIDGRRTGSPGGGAFLKWSKELQLTADKRTRSKWRVPKWMQPKGRLPLGAHSDGRRWESLPGDRDGVLLHSVGRGQEFVLDVGEYPEAVPWLKALLRRHATPVGPRRGGP